MPPTITALALADYATSMPTRRQMILERAKYPALQVEGGHAATRELVCERMVSGLSPVLGLPDDAVARLPPTLQPLEIEGVQVDLAIDVALARPDGTHGGLVLVFEPPSDAHVAILSVLTLHAMAQLDHALTVADPSLCAVALVHSQVDDPGDWLLEFDVAVRRARTTLPVERTCRVFREVERACRDIARIWPVV